MFLFPMKSLTRKGLKDLQFNLIPTLYLYAETGSGFRQLSPSKLEDSYTGLLPDA